MGKHTDAGTIAAMRAFWLASSRNNTRTAKAFDVSPPTIANYAKSYGWAEWADRVDAAVAAKVEADAVFTQSERRLNLLRLIDKRIKAIGPTVDNPVVMGSVAVEVQRLAQTGELLTGGATERVDLGNLTDDQLRERLARLAQPAGSRDDTDADG